MRPTKRTKAVKKPRKITPKRAVVRKSRIGTTETPLSKLMKLKYLINDAYRAIPNGTETLRSDLDTIEAKSDKTWVMEEMTNLRNDGWVTATKMKVANEMWDKYGG